MCLYSHIITRLVCCQSYFHFLCDLWNAHLTCVKIVLKYWEETTVLGDIIKTLRLSNHYTQEDLAQKLKISKSTIGMYEQNRRSPDLETLLKLSDIFQVSTDYLLGKQNCEYASTPSLISSKETRLLKYFHLMYNSTTITETQREAISQFFPGAKYVTTEEQELLDYYHELSKKDQRWIMGQMIDLIKRADEHSSAIPKAQ